ncbi:kinesin-like protein KIN-14N [Nicotiana sylvestris]|uniref:kinesin-like protein KIN-14N n=1 Tax=Nicotiana sylvestris TaxID=4096 RepID=UPI00388C6457
MVSSSCKFLMLSSLSKMFLYSYLILIHAGIGDVSEMSPAPPGKEIESPIPKSGKDNKRKRVSKPEDPQDKRASTRRRRRNLIPVDIDLVHQLNDEEEDEGEDSALVARARKPVEVAKPSETETLPRDEKASKKDTGKTPESLEVEIVPRLSTSHSPSPPAYSEEAIREARALQMPDLGGVPNEEDPFRNCFTGVDDAIDLSDASTLFEEAQCLLSQAFTRFRADLSQYEAELQKTSDERNALKLLCNQKEEELSDLRTDLDKALSQLQQKLERIKLLRKEVDQIKADCNRWKENMDRLAAEKEADLAKLASAEAQLLGVKEKSSTQVKRIDELEVKLAEARAEVKKTKVTADKTVVVYLRDTEAAQMQLREAFDREQRSNDLAKYQSWRETLAEIHTRGYDLFEDIAQAKAHEADARFLISSSDDDNDEGNQGGSDNDEGPEEEAAPDGETSPHIFHALNGVFETLSQMASLKLQWSSSDKV